MPSSTSGFCLSKSCCFKVNNNPLGVFKSIKYLPKRSPSLKAVTAAKYPSLKIKSAASGNGVSFARFCSTKS
jgi:hypothetical protein